MNGPQAIVVAGPTASGKSALALALAERLRARLAVEIVSVASAQVYRGMDIGTAKPTADERARVPHHGLDLIEPTESYSAARFVADAQRAIAQVRARGALPLVVGGTMLYVKALREGLDEMPAADPALRARLDARAAVEGWPALHSELARVYPASAARLKPSDAQRIQRALEVHALTGRALSSLHRRDESGEGAAPQRLPLIALEPQSRAWLHERIACRFDAMLQAGLLDEVRRLRARGDLDPALPSMRCVGYRQAWLALDAGSTAALRETGIAATRQLAKRQLTWLRGMADRVSIAADAGDAAQQLHDQVLRLLETRDAPG